MAVVYTPIEDRYYWNWSRFPVVNAHIAFDAYDPESIFVEFGLKLQQNYFTKNKKHPLIFPQKIEHLKHNPGSRLILDLCTESWWPPTIPGSNFWHIIYTNLIKAGVRPQQIHFITNNHVQQQLFKSGFPNSRHSHINWWEIFTYYHNTQARLAENTTYKFGFFNRTLREERVSLAYQLLTDKDFVANSLYSIQGRSCQTWNDPEQSDELVKKVTDYFPSEGNEYTPSRTSIQAWVDTNPWKLLPESMDPQGKVYEYNTYFYDGIYNATAACDILITSETNIDGPASLFMATEKVSRPICIGKPFIALSTDNYFAHFEEMGYKSFASVWNENYNNTRDVHLKTHSVVKLIKELNNATAHEFNAMLTCANEIAAHNKHTIQQRTQYSAILSNFDPELRRLFKDNVELTNFFKR